MSTSEGRGAPDSYSCSASSQSPALSQADSPVRSDIWANALTNPAACGLRDIDAKWLDREAAGA